MESPAFVWFYHPRLCQRQSNNVGKELVEHHFFGWRLATGRRKQRHNAVAGYHSWWSFQLLRFVLHRIQKRCGCSTTHHHQLSSGNRCRRYMDKHHHGGRVGSFRSRQPQRGQHSRSCSDWEHRKRIAAHWPQAHLFVSGLRRWSLRKMQHGFPLALQLQPGSSPLQRRKLCVLFDWWSSTPDLL